MDDVVAHGLLEAIEREALQLAWYRGEPPARVRPEWLEDDARQRAAWLRSRGWNAELRWLRGRGGCPVVCAIAERIVDAPGLPAGGSVFTSAAAGALADAVRRALGELITAVEAFDAEPPDPPGDVRALLDDAWHHEDPGPIQRLYLHPAMRPVLDAFLAGPLPDEPPAPVAVPGLVEAVTREGLRVLVVDCTVPGIAPFVVGKVLLAGALQHSFATRHLRLGDGPFAPPPRVRTPPRPGFRFRRGRTTPYPFPLA
jgi:ribosomal protein S12 methylthiotransferase accessory factor